MTPARLRPRAVELALLAFPPALRGPEIADLALDLGARSRRRFARELTGLVAGGLRARSARAAAVPVPRLVADGLCLAAIWILTLDLATLGAQRMRGMSDPLLAWPSLILLAVVLGLGLVGLDRVAGAGALVWTAARMPDLLAAHPDPAAELVPLLCFGTLLLAPRARALDPRGLAWLLVPAVLIATFGPPPPEQSVLALAVVASAIVLSAAYAVVDPRIAIAGALPLAYLTSGHAPQAALVIAAAATVRVALVRRAHPV